MRSEKRMKYYVEWIKPNGLGTDPKVELPENEVRERLSRYYKDIDSVMSVLDETGIMTTPYAYYHTEKWYA